MQIPLSRPDITELEIRYVNEVLKTPYLSLGPKLAEFEEKMAGYLETKFAIAVNSGTSALHLSLKSIGIQEGDEVITTPFSFVASTNCILYERARPIFVDIDPETLNIDPDKIEDVLEDRSSSAMNRSSKIKAILPVHVFGHPCDMERIMELARRYELDVAEDGCEALGAQYPAGAKWRKVGSFGRAGAFGFYPNKQITTGEGGMIVTDDEEIARTCKRLRNQGRGEEEGEGQGWLLHESLGYNYRISDINCALGIAQLERIEEVLAKREKVAKSYNERLAGLGGIKIPYVADPAKVSWFVYVIRLEDRFTREDRDVLLNRLKEEGIGCSNYFPPIHLQPYMKGLGYRRGDFPITEHVADRTIALPFHGNLSEEKVDYVTEKLKGVLLVISY